MKVYQILIHNSYATNDCVVANSMAEAEKSYEKRYPNCKIRSMTELYETVIIAGKE